MENNLEKEFEKQGGIGKAKIGLAVCAVLVAVLVVSSVWLYTRNENLQNQIDSLISDYDSLVSEHNDYIADHQFTDEQYYSAIFSYYYVFPAEQKFGVYDLEDELTGLEWIKPYEEGVFDCSEMSAYLEWYLENEGWNAIIIAGDSPFGSGYHAWLLVETSTDQYMPVESTNIEIVWWDDPYFDNYWIYDYEFETIDDALAYSETEFDWWK